MLEKLDLREDEEVERRCSEEATKLFKGEL